MNNVETVATETAAATDAAGNTTTEARGTGRIEVLAKAFHTLEVIAEVGHPMPLRDIVKATGLPKGTLFRILQTLTSLGYAAQELESGYYHLTGRMSILGRNAREEDLKMLALPVMKSLHDRFNETINLGILDGCYIYYVAVLEAERPLSWKVPTGTRDTYYSTALGRAIASNLEPAQREALVKNTDLRSLTRKTPVDKAALRRLLDETRERGVALDVEENDDGVVCLGAPVRLDGRVAASISISVPTTRWSEELGEQMTKALTSAELSFSSQD